MARPDQVDKLEKVIEPVLDRSGGDEQQVPCTKGPGQTAGGAPSVLQPVRLVDDDQVPRNLCELLSERTTPGRGHRRDHDWGVPRSRRLAPRRAALRESRKPELA